MIGASGESKGLCGDNLVPVEWRMSWGSFVCSSWLDCKRNLVRLWEIVCFFRL